MDEDEQKFREHFKKREESYRKMGSVDADSS